MLENMRHFQEAALDAEKILKGLTAVDITGEHLEPGEQFKVLLAEVKKAAGLRQMAQECARDAAPYIHSRLATIQHTGKDGGPIQTEDVSARARLEYFIDRETGTGGEAESSRTAH